MKIILQRYPWTEKSPLTFGSIPDPESGSGVRSLAADPDLILLAGGMRSMTALVCNSLRDSIMNDAHRTTDIQMKRL